MDEETRKNIQEYVDYISSYLGKTCQVKFDGMLATVLINGSILFTSAGFQNAKLVEAFIGGFANGLAHRR